MFPAATTHPPVEWLSRPATVRDAHPGDRRWRLLKEACDGVLLVVVTEQHLDVFVSTDATADGALKATKVCMDFLADPTIWKWDRYEDGRQWQTHITITRGTADLTADWAALQDLPPARAEAGSASVD